MTEFARRLRQARLDASITQDELAKKMNVSKSTISMWENGNRTPSVGVLLSLANALKTTPAYLSGDAYRCVDGDTYPSTSFKDALFKGYSFTSVSADTLQPLIDIWLDLSDEGQEQLVSYAKFLLSQENK